MDTNLQMQVQMQNQSQVQYNADGVAATSATATPTTTGTSTVMGESEGPAGKRLNYAQQPYKDVFFGLLFIAMIITMLVVTIVYFSGTNVPSVIGEYVGILFALMVIGSIGGICGLQFIKAFPESIIKIYLFSIIGLYIVAAIILFAEGNLLGIFCCFVAFFAIIYTWIVWARIPFTGVLLWIASRICTKYSGVLWTAVVTLILQIGFEILWIFVFIAAVDSNSSIGIILMILCFYWGVQTFAAVSHTTSCGVAATWYFYRDAPSDVTWSALKRTLTTSFGSVCLGALLLAIIETIRAFARSRRGNPLVCICLLLLCCLERFFRYFTHYAFAYVAIYGKTYYESATMTFNLFEKRGWWSIINASVAHVAIVCGSLISGMIIGIIGFLVGVGLGSVVAEYLLGIIGFFVGYYMAAVILKPVESAVCALFVCYAEDPDTLRTNHEEEYKRLTSVEPRLVIYQVAYVQPVGVVQVQYQVQPQVQYQVQPQVQYQVQPQGQYQTQPQVQYQTQPQVQYQTQPQVQYQMQPQGQYQMQPQGQYQGQSEGPYQSQPQYQNQSQYGYPYQTQPQP